MKKETIIKIIGFIAAYFLIIKPLFNKLGITKGKDQKELQQETENEQSPFNGNYWRNFYYQAGVPSNGRMPLTKSIMDKATKAAKLFVNSFGYSKDNEDEAQAAVLQCGSKSVVSLMSFIIARDHKTTMLSLMKYGKNLLPQNGLSDNEIASIIGIVKNMKPV